jgi:hypothetical protein
MKYVALVSYALAGGVGWYCSDVIPRLAALTAFWCCILVINQIWKEN